MADTDNQPSKEQVEAANKAEEAKWQGDFDDNTLAIPYKREDDKDATNSTENSDNKSDDGSGDDKSDDESSDDSGVDDLEYSDPAPVLTVEDPGEYTPKDYSFEVTNKDGKTVKIATPEDAERFADDDENFKTARELKDFMTKSGRMERKLEADKDKYDEAKQKFEEQSAEAQQRQETVENMASEFEYLVSKGLLPPVDKQYLAADWNDPDVAKQPGVKDQITIVNYMVKENEARAKANIKPITSVIDAYNAWKLEQKDSQEETDRKAAGEARRAAGARVAGSSPAAQGAYVPKGIAVGNPNAMRSGAAQWDD